MLRRQIEEGYDNTATVDDEIRGIVARNWPSSARAEAEMLGIGRASLARGRAARCSAPHRSPPYDLGEPASPPPLLNEGPDLGGVGCVAGIRSGPLAPEQSHLDTIFAPRSRHLRGHQHDLRTLEVACVRFATQPQHSDGGHFRLRDDLI